MNILFTDKVSGYINEIPQEEGLNILGKLIELKDDTKTEILERNETIQLSEGESTPIYAYYLDNHEYVIFGFKDRKNMLVLDIIKLIDNKIVSHTLKQEDEVAESGEN